ALFKPLARGVTIPVDDHARAGAGFRQQVRLIAGFFRVAQNLSFVRDFHAAYALAFVTAAHDGDVVTRVEQKASEESHTRRFADAADGQIADADHGRIQPARLEKVIFV